MVSQLAIEAISIIGKNNNPLAIKKFKLTGTSEVDLKYNFISNTMLDVMEERLSGVGGNPIKQDLYLGLLSVLEDLAVVRCPV